MRIYCKQRFSAHILFTVLFFTNQLHADQLPAEAYSCYPRITDMRISTDGSYISYLGTIEGRINLVVIKLADGTQQTLLSTDRQRSRIEACGWVSDNRLICKLTGKNNAGSLFALNADGSERVNYLRKFISPASVHPLYDQPGYVLLSADKKRYGNKPDLYKVNTRDKNSKELWAEGIPGGDWASNNQGTEFINYRKIKYKQNSKLTLNLVTRGPSDEKWVISAEHEMDVDDSFQLLKVDFVRRLLYVRDDKDGRLALYEHGLDHPQERKLLFSHPEVDVTYFSFASDNEPLYATYVDKVRKYHYFNKKYESLHRSYNEALPGITNPRNETRDGRLKILVNYSDTQPPRYFLFNGDDNRLQLLANECPALSAGSFVPQSFVQFTARDGYELHGKLITPAVGEPPYPTIIIINDAGHWISDGFYLPAQFLASRGYAVFEIYNRGTSGFGRSYFEAAKGAWHTLVHHDIIDGIQWLGNQGPADPDKICLIGLGSLGGFQALYTAALQPSLVRCAASLRGLLKIDVKGNAWAFDGTRQELEENSPFNMVEKFSVPILLFDLHLTRPPKNRDIYFFVERLEKAGKQYVFADYNRHDVLDAGLVSADEMLQSEFYIAAEKFFRKYLQ